MRLKYLVPGVLAGITGPKPENFNLPSDYPDGDFETINDTLPESESIALVNYHLVLNIILGLATCTSQSRIINGVEVKPHSWPWTVRLFLQTQGMVDAGSNNGFECGGSVIDENWVLTAAHCCEGISLGKFLL